MKRVLPLLAALAALSLAGCASVSPDGLRGDVAKHTEGRLPAGAQLPSTDAKAQQDAQTQITAGKQHGRQRKQRDVDVRHAGVRASHARRALTRVRPRARRRNGAARSRNRRWT